MKFGSTVKSLKHHCKSLVDASIYRPGFGFGEEIPYIQAGKISSKYDFLRCGHNVPIGRVSPTYRYIVATTKENRTLNLFSLLVYRVLRAISPVIMNS
jgi:hypothetical protein